MKKSLWSVLFLALMACAPSMTQQQIAFLHELADRPVICTSSGDCDEKWNLAIEWVTKHSATGMKSVSDELIQSNSVSDGERPPLRYPEFTVVKYVHGNKHIMSFDSYCDHGFYCNPTGLQLRASFGIFIMGPPPGVTVHADGNGATKALDATKNVHK